MRAINWETLLALGLILQGAHYLVFMRAGWGPVRDVDLFFGVHIIFAFFAGTIIESITQHLNHKHKFLIFALYLGYTAVSYYQLFLFSLPEPTKFIF